MEIIRTLAVMDGVTLTGGRQISDTDYSEYRKHFETLTDFGTEYDVLRMVEESYNDFFNHLDTVAKNIAATDHIISQDQFEPLTFTSSRLFMNYLAAVRTLVDHTQTLITRKYGNPSPQLVQFKGLAGLEYDSLASYRLLYKFRNYVQHCGLPPVEFLIEHEPGVSIKLDLTVDPSRLLEIYTEWGVAVRSDLESYEGKISLLAILAENFESVKRIFWGVFVQNNMNNVRLSGDWIKAFLGEGNICSSLCFVNLPADQPAGPNLNLKLQWIPAHILRLIGIVEESSSAISAASTTAP